MRFEQMITMYGTICVNAKNKKQAQKQIDNIIDGLSDNLSIEPLLVGDVDRAGQIYRMKG